MALPDITTVHAKWKANTSAAAGKWAANSESTQIDPTQAAINAIPMMQSNFNAAIADGRVANGLRRAGKQKWLAGINAAVSSGKFAAGVNGADANFQQGFGALLADERNGLAQLPTDNSTQAARRARLIAWADWMDGYKQRNP